MIILSVILIGYNFWTTNLGYFKADVIKTFTVNFENRLLLRFEQLEGFSIDMPIAVITDGEYVYGKKISEDINLFPKIKNAAGFRYNIIGTQEPGSSTRKAKVLIENLLGVSLKTADKEQIEKIMKTDEYKSMGVYPAFDSVKIIDGVAVANFIDNRND